MSASSQINRGGITQQNVKVPTKEINEDYIMTNANTQRGSKNITINPKIELNEDRYIVENPLKGSFNTNISSNVNITSLDQLRDNKPRLKDPLHSSISAPMKLQRFENRTGDNIELERVLPLTSAQTNIQAPYIKNGEYTYINDLQRNLPEASAQTNKGISIGDTYSNTKRKHTLLPTLNKGGFENPVYKPQFRGDHDEVYLDHRKHDISKKAYQFFQERATGLIPSIAT